ncbi:uncharacterized protein LOC129984783 [Argiope bruennichi]|uniref:uncharacterized protein LOC129984783 n=1 Tax=Argiope bruennichi TaxID=94029 RepID=UPI0024949BB1|nr:uncharacterized protein LOC129984783 [Argiope bruennichi]
MDALINKRKSLRFSFLLKAKRLEQYLTTDAKNADNLQALSSQLAYAYSRLEQVQTRISNFLLEEKESVAQYAEDFKSTEKYRDMYIELNSKVENYLASSANSTCGQKTFSFSLAAKNLEQHLEIITKNSDKLSSLTSQLDDKFYRLGEIQSQIKMLLSEENDSVVDHSEKSEYSEQLRFERDILLYQIYFRDMFFVFIFLLIKTGLSRQDFTDLKTFYELIESKLGTFKNWDVFEEKFDSLEQDVDLYLKKNMLQAWNEICDAIDDKIWFLNIFMHFSVNILILHTSVKDLI